MTELPPLKFISSKPKISESTYETIKAVAKHNILFPTESLTHYDFCNPRHKLHASYEKLLNQYKIAISQDIPSFSVLERAIARAASISSSKNPAKGVHKPTTKSTPLTQHQINWQDFVVLETIEFFTSDIQNKSNLLAPLTLSEIQTNTIHKDGNNQDSNLAAEPLLKSPFTNELIPASKFDEHIKIHSLDPNWKSQKSKELAREMSTNLDLENTADQLAKFQAKKRKQ